MWNKPFSPREKKLAVFLALVLFLLAFYAKNSRQGPKDQEDFDPAQALEMDTSQDQPIEKTAGGTYVHITGAVKKPGLYEFSEAVRVMDVVNTAGGFTDQADPDQLNLAAKVQDEARIHVPSKNEKTQQAQGQSSAQNQDKININTASLEDLQKIPGVGEKTAQRILEQRQESPYQKIEDLKNLPGIGDKKFEEMKDYVSVF